MATQVQMRRGTSLENDDFTGAEGEITIDTTNDTIRVHDGIKKGGYPIPKGLSADRKPTPGTYTKVTVTGDGFVSSGGSLAPSDIPDLKDKYVSKNDNISGGTFAKITFDEKGLVKRGENLSASDIPTLPISKVTTLQSALDEKAKKLSIEGKENVSSQVVLVEGAVNVVSVNESATLVPPSAITDSTKLNQIMVQLDNSRGYEVRFSAGRGFGGGNVPVVTEAGFYNVYFEYNVPQSLWVCGVIKV